MLAGPLGWLCLQARRNLCDDACWAKGCAWFADRIEQQGISITIEGLDVLERQTSPFVIEANHMGSLETFLLPGIVRPYSPVTFVVKESLVKMPFFGPLMRSRNPVVVKRKNPREDLTTVLREGEDRLRKGISIIVFPQSTRMKTFSPAHFNTIGEKLAKRADVPVIPLALKTDAWQMGTHVKEIGHFVPQIPVHFRFGKEERCTGNGREVHERICTFIGESLAEWERDEQNAHPGGHPQRP